MKSSSLKVNLQWTFQVNVTFGIGIATNFVFKRQRIGTETCRLTIPMNLGKCLGSRYSKKMVNLH